jgi:hypothetical protein
VHSKEWPMNPIDDWLWCVTFSRPGDDQLSRHYNTYGISARTGEWIGMGCPPYHPNYPRYKIMDQFSGIARDLIILDIFDRYRDMWYEAFRCALKQAEEAVGTHHSGKSGDSIFDHLVDWLNT